MAESRRKSVTQTWGVIGALLAAGPTLAAAAACSSFSDSEAPPDATWFGASQRRFSRRARILHDAGRRSLCRLQLLGFDRLRERLLERDDEATRVQVREALDE